MKAQWNENVSENQKVLQRSLKEILKRCDIGLVNALQFQSCSNFFNVTLSCGKESNQASSWIYGNKSIFRALPWLNNICSAQFRHSTFCWAKENKPGCFKVFPNHDCDDLHYRNLVPRNSHSKKVIPRNSFLKSLKVILLKLLCHLFRRSRIGHDSWFFKNFSFMWFFKNFLFTWFFKNVSFMWF